MMNEPMLLAQHSPSAGAVARHRPVASPAISRRGRIIQLSPFALCEIFAFWSLFKTFFTKRPLPKLLLQIDHF